MSRNKCTVWTLLLILVSTIASIICLTGNNPVFKHLFLLPLVTGFILIVHLSKTKIQTSLAVLIIGTSIYIRNVISPVILTLDKYQSKFMNISQANVDNAILIMLWETLVISLLVKYLSQKKYKRRDKKYIFIGSQIYRISIALGIFISIYALIESPQLRSGFFSIFTSNFYDISNQIVVDPSASASVLRNGGDVLIKALRLVIPITIIVAMRRKYGQRYGTFVVSLAISFVQVLFMTDENFLILLYVAIQLLLVFKIYPNYRRAIKLVILISFVTGAFLMLTHRFLQTDSAYSHSVSEFMQSYLGGVCDIAGIFKYERRNTLTHMLIDYYSCVPFRRFLFGYSGSDLLTVNWFNAVNGTHSQILPSVAESYYYFGYLLAPLHSMILASIGWLYERKAANEKHFLYYSLYTLIYVMASISIVMYDFRIFLTDVFNIFIWMWMFVRLSKGVSLYIINDLEVK